MVWADKGHEHASRAACEGRLFGKKDRRSCIEFSEQACLQDGHLDLLLGVYVIGQETFEQWE